jgi:hypothetical protein
MAATASTPANLVIGAGNGYRKGESDPAFVDLGVTREDNVFRVEETRFEPDDLNGVPGLLKDTMYIVTSTGMLEITTPEISAERLLDSWPGASADQDDDGTVTINRDGNARRVPSSAYADYELRVKGATRRYTFYVNDAINTESPQFDLQNAGLSGPRLVLGSRWTTPPAMGSGDEDPEDVVYPSPHGIRYRELAVGSGS